MVGYTHHPSFVKGYAKATLTPTDWLRSAIAIGLLLAAVGVGVHLAGGTHSPLTQLMYIPILLAAALLELPGSVVTALLAGTIVGSLMSYNALTGAGQPASSWLYRSALFLLFGIAAGYLMRVLHRHSQKPKEDAGLPEVYTRVLSSLAMTVELRDEPARGHCERVAHNAVAMGRELGLSETRLETLHWGALLHDLGKISVPESILLKPGPLTEQEHAEIQRHPAYGADLLESVAPEFGDIARVVRYHHERWDGRGYPQALSEQEIPLMSRIVAVVDVFEALTSRRPYRRPMPALRALSYLKAESGSHFDPELVSLFEKLYDRGEIRVAQPVAESVGYVPYRCGLKSVNS